MLRAVVLLLALRSAHLASSGGPAAALLVEPASLSWLAANDPHLYFLGRHIVNGSMARFDWVRTGVVLQLANAADVGDLYRVTAAEVAHGPPPARWGNRRMIGSLFASKLRGPLLVDMDTGGHASFAVYRRHADGLKFKLERTMHLEGGRRTYELLDDATEGDAVTMLKLTPPFVGQSAKQSHAPVALFGIGVPAGLAAASYDPRGEQAERAGSARTLDIFGGAECVDAEKPAAEAASLRSLEEASGGWLSALLPMLSLDQTHAAVRVQAMDGLGVTTQPSMESLVGRTLQLVQKVRCLRYAMPPQAQPEAPHCVLPWGGALHDPSPPSSHPPPFVTAG